MDNINIYAFSDEASTNLSGQISTLTRNGLSGMEIRNVDGENVSDVSLNKAHEIKSTLDNNGLKVFSIGSPIGKIDIIKDDLKAHLEKFKHTLEIAEILDCKNIRFFSFYVEDEKAEEYKDVIFEQLFCYSKLAKAAGVTLCHENEKDIFGWNIERCLEIFKKFSDIKGVFDPANFIQCGINPMDAWEKLKNYIRYLHIKDALLDGTVVPAGKGCGNIKEIAKDYISLNGRDFTLEPHLMVFDGFAKLEKDKKNINGIYTFNSNDQAFDTACICFKDILKEIREELI